MTDQYQTRAAQSAAAQQRELGTGKHWDQKRGYGFIARDRGDPAVFVHITELRTGAVRPGDRVSYDLSRGRGRLRAVAVEHVDHD